MLDPRDELTQSVVAFPTALSEFEERIDKTLSQGSVSPGSRDRRLRLFRKFFDFPEDKACSDQVAEFIRYFATTSSAGSFAPPPFD